MSYKCFSLSHSLCFELLGTMIARVKILVIDQTGIYDGSGGLHRSLATNYKVLNGET